VDRLRIDPETGLVYGSRFERRDAGALLQSGAYTPMLGVANRTYVGNVSSGSGVQVLEYDWISVDAPESVDAFTFHPPPGSKKVDKPWRGH
jgi:hypothetical protein